MLADSHILNRDKQTLGSLRGAGQGSYLEALYSVGSQATWTTPDWNAGLSPQNREITPSYHDRRGF